MRTIKFRGWGIHVKRWIFGDLLHTDKEDGRAIQYYDEEDGWMCDNVNEKTVGQFTSLYDRNKKEIYEGDLLKLQDDDTGLIEVRFVRGVFAFLWQGNLDDEMPINAPTHEWATVVGNIHDNHELMEAAAK